MTALQEKANRFVEFFNMIEASSKLVDTQLNDNDVVISFTGSGCSDSLTVKNFRDLKEAIKDEVVK